MTVKYMHLLYYTKSMVYTHTQVDPEQAKREREREKKTDI